LVLPVAFYHAASYAVRILRFVCFVRLMVYWRREETELA
jgi:hypothetical protein